MNNQNHVVTKQEPVNVYTKKLSNSDTLLQRTATIHPSGVIILLSLAVSYKVLWLIVNSLMLMKHSANSICLAKIW